MKAIFGVLSALVVAFFVLAGPITLIVVGLLLPLMLPVLLAVLIIVAALSALGRGLGRFFDSM